MATPLDFSARQGIRKQTQQFDPTNSKHVTQYFEDNFLKLLKHPTRNKHNQDMAECFISCIKEQVESKLISGEIDNYSKQVLKVISNSLYINIAETYKIPENPNGTKYSLLRRYSSLSEETIHDSNDATLVLTDSISLAIDYMRKDLKNFDTNELGYTRISKKMSKELIHPNEYFKDKLQNTGCSIM